MSLVVWKCVNDRPFTRCRDDEGRCPAMGGQRASSAFASREAGGDVGTGERERGMGAPYL